MESDPDDEMEKQYEVLQQIGSGSYGRVYECVHKKTKKKVAVKKMLDIGMMLKDVLREIVLLRKLGDRCEHVCKLIDILPPNDPEDFNHLYIVMELADSNLKKLFGSSLMLNDDQSKSIVYDLICGLKYMHSSKVLHRDIKPGNILINEDCSIRICDFGLARSVHGIVTGDVLVDGIVEE